MKSTTYKACSACSRLLPIGVFGVRRASKDGRTAACRECLSERDRLRESPKRAAARKAYSKTPEGREAGGRAKREWIKRNAEKRTAQLAVGNAVRDGRMFKPEECEMCGELGRKIHGHHDDYSKPLEVRWVCPPCHKEIHRGV